MRITKLLSRLFLPAFAVAALAALADPLAAQTFPTDDAVIKRMWRLGMDSSQTYKLAQQLLDSIGPRLQGTPNQKKAQQWLVDTYKGWGVEAKNEQFGTWRGWRRGYSHIDLIEPRQRTLTGTMLGYSPGTGKKDIDAEVVVLPRFADSTQFVQWLPKAKGKIVMVSAALPTCRPADDWDRNATKESAARMDTLKRAAQAEWTNGRDARGNSTGVRGTGLSLALGGGELAVRLEEGGVAGVISSRPKNSRGAMEVFETYTKKVPTIALDCEDYGLVFRMAENNQHPKIRMNLDAELLGEVPVFNTIAMIKGQEKPDEYVMLSAHFDSWDASSGATDNGTGSLMALEAMRILRTAYPKPKRTIIVGHWSGEEIGLVGSKAFAKDHPEIVNKLQAIFNQDNGTGRVQRISGGGLVDSPNHIVPWLNKLPAEFKSQLAFAGPGSPSGGGTDDASFSCSGAPSFGLGGAGWDYGTYTWHTDRDTFDKVVFDDLKGNATIAAMLAYLASEDPTFVSRERVDLAKAAAERAAAAGAGAGAGRGGAPASFTWPVCSDAARSTNPRLK